MASACGWANKAPICIHITSVLRYLLNQMLLIRCIVTCSHCAVACPLSCCNCCTKQTGSEKGGFSDHQGLHASIQSSSCSFSRPISLSLSLSLCHERRTNPIGETQMRLSSATRPNPIGEKQMHVDPKTAAVPAVDQEPCRFHRKDGHALPIIAAYCYRFIIILEKISVVGYDSAGVYYRLLVPAPPGAKTRLISTYLVLCM